MSRALERRIARLERQQLGRAPARHADELDFFRRGPKSTDKLGAYRDQRHNSDRTESGPEPLAV